MEPTKCGAHCAECGFRDTCGGCAKTDGHPFGGECMIAACCRQRGQKRCSGCGQAFCRLKSELIAEFNALGIEDMPEVTSLNALKGSFVNLEYTLPGGQKIRFWDDNRIYLGNQLCKKGSERCYGLTADENDLLVCEYGEGGSEAEIVVYKRRR